MSGEAIRVFRLGMASPEAKRDKTAVDMPSQKLGLAKPSQKAERDNKRYSLGSERLGGGQIRPLEAMAIARLIPKAKPVYPPPEIYKMPSLKEMLFYPWVSKLMLDEGIEIIRNGAGEIKNKITDGGNEIMQQITYPESLINEAVNRGISKKK